MKKILVVLLALLLIVSSAAIAETTNCTDKNGDGVITIGGLVPVTTEPLSSYGAIHGAEIAVNEINEAGGVLGMQIEYIYEDMASDADVALNATNKLIARGDVDVMMGLCFSSSALACEETIGKAKVPTIIAGTSPKLAVIENNYIFRGRCSDAYQTAIALAFLIDQGIVTEGSTLGMLYNANDFGIGAYEVIETATAAKGIKLVSEAYNVDDSDVTSQVMKLMNNDVSALIVWSSANGVPVAARAITELGVSCPVVGSPACLQSNVLSTCPEWVEGWYSVADVCLTSTEENITNFYEKWDARYSRDELTFDAMYTYSWVYLCKEAFERAGTAETEAFVAAMNETKGFVGLNGIYEKFDNIEMLSTASIQRLVDGQIEFVTLADGRM